jgi:hypothetical protein
MGISLLAIIPFPFFFHCIRFLCGELHRVTASRLVQGKCKANAVWQARLANAEPQPSLAIATSCLQLQSYKK